MTTRIDHDDAGSQYVIYSDDERAGFAKYHRDGTRWVFYHTVVDPAFQGRGLAGQLIGHALTEVVAAGGTIVPECSYVEAYVKRHPEFAEHVQTPDRSGLPREADSSELGKPLE